MREFAYSHTLENELETTVDPLAALTKFLVALTGPAVRCGPAACWYGSACLALASFSETDKNRDVEQLKIKC